MKFHLLLIVSLTFSSLAFAYDRPERKEALIPSDHGIKLNRDFTNMIQYGLIEGLFKVKMSGLPDCTAEGMTIWRASGRLANRMRLEGGQDEDFLNLF